MEKFTIKDLYAKPTEFADKQVEIEGWIKTSRGSKKNMLYRS